MPAGSRTMMALLASGIALAASGCGHPRPASPEERTALAASQAVAALRADTSSYRIIYHPAVNLARQSGR